ncbi:MAG: DUF1598 domain-containing protein [Planctomycetales bacterium]|nr:DUF1598 domain-containing protein [Planctomycetales bacterium]
MISGHPLATFTHRFLIGAALLVSLACQSTYAQFGIGFARGGVVGGVSIDADGAVRNASLQEREGWLQDLRQAVQPASGELAGRTELRMISLSKLQAEIERAMAADKPLADEVRYLAGLQRVEYIFAYPEANDIVLAGPAEGWVVRQDATVVGETSGRPVLQLEDLLTALRTTEAARERAISVSIDPTPAGELRLNRLLSQVRLGAGFNPATLEPAMRQAFGPQQVKLTTVASDSRMAQTLVAADYRMKRLAMNLDESPVGGLSSYMEMIKDGGASHGVQPRWWMACQYDAILHSEDRLAWKLTGQGLKAMTEDEFVDANGARRASGQTSKLAQRWADIFTQKFDELCSHDAAFGDLRNVMDLNIVATVISGHELEKAVDCDLGLLKGENGRLPTPSWTTPKTISPECSFVRGRAGWTVSASGGVDINPWKVVSQQSQADESVQLVRSRAQESRAAAKWWWN